MKSYYQNLSNDLYLLTPETTVNENTCWFVRGFFEDPNFSILNNHSVALRGNYYDENGRITDYTAMSAEEVLSSLFNLIYNGIGRVIPNPDCPHYSTRPVAEELISRWSKGSVIWCEKASDGSMSLEEYITKVSNPKVMVSAKRDIIVISDDPDRPGDIVVRFWMA